MLQISVDERWPNARQIERVAQIIESGGLVVYPTDTIYGLGCDMMNRKSVERVYEMKGKNRKHPLSFICPDLKNIARFAVVSNIAYRLMKRILPGAYTIILPAAREVPHDDEQDGDSRHTRARSCRDADARRTARKPHRHDVCSIARTRRL